MHFNRFFLNSVKYTSNRNHIHKKNLHQYLNKVNSKNIYSGCNGNKYISYLFIYINSYTKDVHTRNYTKTYVYTLLPI